MAASVRGQGKAGVAAPPEEMGPICVLFLAALLEKQ
jgi:hypothetical protein